MDGSDERELRAVFALDAPGRVERIQRLLTSGKLATAADETHSLSGAAATVGLEAVATEAEFLEAELRDGAAPEDAHRRLERIAVLVAELEIEAESEPIPAAPPAAGAGRTVLHVEDNPVNAKLVERALARRPHVRLLTAPRADAGLRAAREACPDLILLDLNLPDASGHDVLRRLRSDRTTRDVPVVLVTGHTTARALESLDGLGVREHLTKPIDIGRLLELVDEHAPAVP